MKPSAGFGGSRLTSLLHVGEVVYIADVPHNPAPVVFHLTRIDDDGFVFENPAHDFPQVIAYRRVGDRLHVRVSAGDKASEFQFRRNP